MTCGSRNARITVRMTKNKNVKKAVSSAGVMALFISAKWCEYSSNVITYAITAAIALNGRPMTKTIPIVSIVSSRIVRYPQRNNSPHSSTIMESGRRQVLISLQPTLSSSLAQRAFLNAFFPANRASAPSPCSMRSNWLNFAIRSLRQPEPVLRCPALVATVRSAIVVSSVSPER